MTARAASRAPGGSLLAAAVAFLWFYNGVNFLAFKVGVEALPPALLGALRFTAAGMALLPLAAWRVAHGARPSLRTLLTAALLGILMLGGGQALALEGVRFLPAGISSVFGSTPPLFLALFSWLALGRALRRRELAGVGVGFVGTALLGWSSAAGDGGFSPTGAAALLGATACWAAGSLAASRVDLPPDPVVNLVVQLLAAGLLLCAVSWLTGSASRFDPGVVPRRAWAALAFLTVVSTLLGYSVFTWVNRAASSTLANSYNYAAPVITMLLAAAFLGERLSWAKAGAAAVALGGVALIAGAHPASGPRSA